jgi:polyhydroxyalkanoate synthesis regulator phasin
MNLDDQQKNLYNGPGDRASHGLQNADEKKRIVDDFFNEKPSREATYKKHNFKEMHEYIQEIKSDLTVVGESMKKFDDTINKSWRT